MAHNRHRDKQLTQNQNNLMSEDDPGDGSRNSDRLGAVDKSTKGPVSPEENAQHGQEALEVFGEEGAGVAAKE